MADWPVKLGQCRPFARDQITASDIMFAQHMEKASSDLLAAMWRENPFEMAYRTGRLTAPVS